VTVDAFCADFCSVSLLRDDVLLRGFAGYFSAIRFCLSLLIAERMARPILPDELLARFT
jgi:hypothetical protein